MAQATHLPFIVLGVLIFLQSSTSQISEDYKWPRSYRGYSDYYDTQSRKKEMTFGQEDYPLPGPREIHPGTLTCFECTDKMGPGVPGHQDANCASHRYGYKPQWNNTITAAYNRGPYVCAFRKYKNAAGNVRRYLLYQTKVEGELNDQEHYYERYCRDDLCNNGPISDFWPEVTKFNIRD